MFDLLKSKRDKVFTPFFLLSPFVCSQEVPQKDLELEETPLEQGGEQGRWEEERLKTASLSFGAKKEREQGMRREQEKYQLLLEDDEMIDFVSTAITMKGTLTEKVAICYLHLERSLRLVSQMTVEKTIHALERR